MKSPQWQLLRFNGFVSAIIMQRTSSVCWPICSWRMLCNGSSTAKPCSRAEGFCFCARRTCLCFQWQKKNGKKCSDLKPAWVLFAQSRWKCTNRSSHLHPVSSNQTFNRETGYLLLLFTCILVTAALCKSMLHLANVRSCHCDQWQFAMMLRIDVASCPAALPHSTSLSPLGLGADEKCLLIKQLSPCRLYTTFSV